MKENPSCLNSIKKVTIQMPSYQHLLIGLDLTTESSVVLHKAHLLAQACKATLSIAHALEPLTFAYGGDMPIDLSELQDQLQLKAAQELSRLLKQHNIKADQHVLVGQATTELQLLAEKINADLIVVGSHGRKGFALLLGSTSNSVLQGANCDVLAVRVDTEIV